MLRIKYSQISLDAVVTGCSLNWTQSLNQLPSMQQPIEYCAGIRGSGPHAMGYQLTAAIHGLGAMLTVRVMAVSWIAGSPIENALVELLRRDIPMFDPVFDDVEWGGYFLPQTGYAVFPSYRCLP